MKQTINLNQFRDGFQIRKENFSYEGLEALYNHLTEIENDTNTEIEYDPIAICCDYSEYETAIEAVKDYSPDIDILTEKEAINWLNDKSIVIVFDTGVIIQNF